jgi:hypothetical protein
MYGPAFGFSLFIQPWDITYHMLHIKIYICINGVSGAVYDSSSQRVTIVIGARNDRTILMCI